MSRASLQQMPGLAVLQDSVIRTIPDDSPSDTQSNRSHCSDPESHESQSIASDTAGDQYSSSAPHSPLPVDKLTNCAHLESSSVSSKTEATVVDHLEPIDRADGECLDEDCDVDVDEDVDEEEDVDDDGSLLNSDFKSDTPNGAGDDDQLPDNDAIKLFVGQIPREWSEGECEQLLLSFGRIHSLRLLRDRLGQSRGCLFVTYFRRKSALAAQDALHNVRRLPGMAHPLQLKPANALSSNQRKLFVGMLGPAAEESAVRQMFDSFGVIDECSVLRDTDGQSRGKQRFSLLIFAKTRPK
jgi:hypothetical protein